MDGPDTAMATDLALDPSDPLNLLIHDSSSSRDSASQDVEWSQFSSLWQSNHFTDSNNKAAMGGSKFPDFSLDYNMNLPLDMDFNQTMSIDPSALQFDPHGPYTVAPFTNAPSYNSLSQDLLSATFPFTFTPAPVPTDAKPRRLSTTSSSSSSGASLSPVLENSQGAPSTDSCTSSIADPADELAERVRQAAGVMLAVPGGVPGHLSSQQARMSVVRPLKPTKAHVRPPKRQPVIKPPSPSTSASSSPGPESPPTAGSAPPPTLVISCRPKTSHTTIERRYRTNLNARIQSLRAAVPALRVLDHKAKDGNGGVWADIVDARGFVDGVKVATKVSKANVLGKAVEYIRVLKKREARLKREQNGLKSLLCGLVGGPALLKEWESNWQEQFGGPETDEVEEEEKVGEMCSDDEDEEGDLEGETDGAGEGRSSKKLRIAKEAHKEKMIPKVAGVMGEMSLPMQLQGIAPPERKKRGRPRKSVQLSPPSSFASAESSDDPGQVQRQGQAQQYLLATFALFSFFGSPFTTAYNTPSAPSAHPPTHSGSVLGHGHAAASMLMAQGTYGWRDTMQAFHLFVSVLVLLSIVAPWVPILNKWNPARRLAPFGSAVPLLSSFGDDHDKRPSSRDALPTKAFDLQAVMRWIGVGAWKSMGMGRNEWMKRGQSAALQASVSLVTRLQTYWYLSSHISRSPSVSTSELVTLALVVQPLFGERAAQLWSRAAAERLSPYERVVLQDLSVHDAAERLRRRQNKIKATELLAESGEESAAMMTPVKVLAQELLVERMKKYAALLFVRVVSATVQEEEADLDLDARAEREKSERSEQEATVEAAKSLGGRTAMLAALLEGATAGDESCTLSLPAVAASGEAVPKEVIKEQEEEGMKGVRALLSAVVLYRRVFPSATTAAAVAPLSPPPSPGARGEGLALRLALGAPVFEQREAWGEDVASLVEDARDRVVDMLVDRERAAKWGR